MEPITSTQSERIWMIKAVAIFSVFFAHMPWSIENPIMHKIYCLIGICGVPIFLFVSGFLFVRSHTSLYKKVVKLCVPLLIWSTLSFAVSCFLNKNVMYGSFPLAFNYLRWILGSGSVYYFVPLLLICMLLSQYFNKYLLMFVSCVSIALSWDYVPHNEIFTRYLNPFNFIIYFELGKLVREKGWKTNNNFAVAICSLIVLVTIGFLWDSLDPCYFSICCIPFVIAAFLLVNSSIAMFPVKQLIPIGKYSFVIYLSHIHIAGLINSRMHGWLEFFKVPLAFVVVCFLVVLLHIFLNKTDRDKRFLSWFGFR